MIYGETWVPKLEGQYRTNVTPTVKFSCIFWKVRKKTEWLECVK